jgi:hypothetical protein
MWQRFEDNGWDKREPDPQSACETSRGFEQLVYRALAEDKVSEAKAAELLGLSLAEFAAQRNMAGRFDPAALQHCSAGRTRDNVL